MSERRKEFREWLNLLCTIVGPAVLFWGLWSLRSELHVQRLEIQKEADAKYIAQSDFKEFQTTTNNKLDKLTDGMAVLQSEVAGINGKLARRGP